MNILNKYVILSLLSLTFLLAIGCSTTERGTVEEKTSEPDSTFMAFENLTSLDFLLYISRSNLSDLHASQHHDMPKNFLKKKSGNESINSDPFDGYRVQIISTRNVQLADSVANDFRMWSDTTIAGYSAKSYVFFKQPFYKVHVGDFQLRDKANDFTQLVKDKYPAAWVVHDRIEPSNTPADTATFSIITPEDRLKKMGADSVEN